MGVILGRDAVDGYVWLRPGDVRLTGGPERTATDEKPDPEFRRRPVGFTAPLEEVDGATS